MSNILQNYGPDSPRRDLNVAQVAIADDILLKRATTAQLYHSWQFFLDVPLHRQFLSIRSDAFGISTCPIRQAPYHPTYICIYVLYVPAKNFRYPKTVFLWRILDSLHSRQRPTTLHLHYGFLQCLAFHNLISLAESQWLASRTCLNTNSWNNRSLLTRRILGFKISSGSS